MLSCSTANYENWKRKEIRYRSVKIVKKQSDYVLFLFPLERDIKLKSEA